MERIDINVKGFAKANIVARRIIKDAKVELAYIRRAKAGDTDARNLLLEAQLLSLYSLALSRKYGAYRGDASEMVDAVAVRFDEIISKFDETMGVRLFTHLIQWARSEMGTELMADRPGIRVPANIFKDKNGKASEVASVVSGFKRLGDDDEGDTIFDTIADKQADVFSDAVDYERKEMVRRFMDQLSPIEKTVIKKIFFDEIGIRDVAESIHTSPSRVRRIRDAAIAKMQKIARDELDHTFDEHAIV